MNDTFEIFGYAGAALTLVAWGMRDQKRMRIAALGSNSTFLLYGLVTENWPLVIMDLALIPLNGVRLWQITAGARRTTGFDNTELDTQDRDAAALAATGFGVTQSPAQNQSSQSERDHANRILQ